jgi:hypothetical protein
VNIPVQTKFIEWFYNKSFPSYDSKRNRNGFLNDMLDMNKIDHDALQYWIQEAFHQGAKAQRELNGEK